MTPDSLIEHEELRIAGDDLCNMNRRPKCKFIHIRDWARKRDLELIGQKVDLAV